ncbi:unnamed protein product [Spirodela intermedia]|uniref:Leucine-rich repeat-containing N-terminal plant-type domain-containing protein n=1 Tax=Spirodela intermedia TaxID=51605 RepID=A0A7I8LIX9_SPIIN|nr:unnamed protein product [Spirodela intermedia]
MISSPAGGARTLRYIVPGRLILVLVIIASSGRGWEVMCCHDEERKALLEIKTSINFPNKGLALPDWGNSTTEVGEDCCQWPGITCDFNTGHVVEIDLYSERSSAKETWSPNLTMLAELGQLKKLNLGLNKMNGGIPEGR